MQIFSPCSGRCFYDGLFIDLPQVVRDVCLGEIAHIPGLDTPKLHFVLGVRSIYVPL